MRTVHLPGTSLNCSALGFGCANLMGRVGRRQSEAALARAYDRGVTFFDTARSYGWGRSEEVLGHFLRGKRDRVVVATKFGSLPPPYNPLREFAKPVARHLLTAAKRFGLGGLDRAVRGQVKAHSAVSVIKGVFDPAAAGRSIDESLKQLGTDYIDIVFLHNPRFEDVASGETFDFLAGRVKAGQVRHFGVSADTTTTSQVAALFPAVGVVQVANHLFEDGLAALSQRSDLAVVTNTPFGSGAALEKLAAALAADPERTRDWSVRLGWDPSAAGGPGRLLLSWALAANPGGVVLCGMHEKTRIDANCAVAAGLLSASVGEVGADIRRAVVERNACINT